MEEIERRYILNVLAAVHGKKTAAARIVGLERERLHRKLEKAGRTLTEGTVSS
jgi:DNA-binding NtrC family response regulator